MAEKLKQEKIPCARVNNLIQALDDEQIIYRNMMVYVEHPDGGSVKIPGNPIKLSHDSADFFTSPPLLGQHSNEIFNELLAYDAKKIDELIKQGVIEINKDE